MRVSSRTRGRRPSLTPQRACPPYGALWRVQSVFLIGTTELLA